jgi:hypothetical protein
MNPMTHIEHPRQTRHSRVASAMWDDFEPTTRRRRAPVAGAPIRTKAHARHSHLTFADTPDLFLREEMI